MLGWWWSIKTSRWMANCNLKIVTSALPLLSKGKEKETNGTRNIIRPPPSSLTYRTKHNNRNLQLFHLLHSNCYQWGYTTFSGLHFLSNSDRFVFVKKVCHQHQSVTPHHTLFVYVWFTVTLRVKYNLTIGFLIQKPDFEHYNRGNIQLYSSVLHWHRLFLALVILLT